MSDGPADRTTADAAVVTPIGDRYEVPVDPHAENNAHAFALQMVGSDRRVLELGCATGHVTQRLVEAGNTVVGAEFDPDAAARAEQVAQRVHVVDLDRDRISSLETEPVDVILAGDVLEHLRDPLAALVDAMTLLAPDGDVVVSVPNAVHGDVRLHVLEGRVEYLDDGLLDQTHLRWFTRDSLRAFLDDAGLVPVEVRRVKLAMGESNVASDPALHSRATVDFVRSDPEHDTFQFVVRARRRSEVEPAEIEADLLGRPAWTWATYPDEDIDELRAYAHNLRVALDAWERSRTARALATVRRVTDRIPGLRR